MIQYITYIFATVIFSLLVVVAFGGGVAISSKLRENVVAWIFPLIGSAIVLRTIFGNRNVDLYILNPAFSSGEGVGMGVTILRVCMWSILALCGGLILTSVISQKKEKLVGQGLLISFLVYFLFSMVANSAFGTVPSFDYKAMYSPIVVVAIFYGQKTTHIRLIHFAKTTGAISIFLGLMAAVLAPSIAIQSNFTTGLLPWPQIRLWGLDSHANTLGPLAMMVLLLEFGQAYSRKWLHHVTLVACLITLVLTQSKTAWVSTLVAGLIFWFLNYFDTKWDNKKNPNAQLLVLIIIVFGLAVAASSFVFLLLNGAGDRIVEFFSTSEGAKLSSMTGRDVIWRITFQEFYNNSLFGYGPKLWGQEYSARYNLLGVASNAHNQIVDLLGASGLFGAAAFLLYLGALFKYSLAVTKTVGRIPLVLLIAMCIRAIPEVPFRLENVLSNDFSLHMILIGILFTALRQQESEKIHTI